MFKFTPFLAIVTFAILSQTNPILGNPVDGLLNVLEVAVDRSIAKATASLEAAKANLTQEALRAQARVQTVLKEVEDVFKQELKAIKLIADLVKVDIDECLGQDERDLLYLPTTANDSLVDSIAGIVNKASESAQDALNKIQSASTHVENYRQEIEDCGHHLISIVCLAKLSLIIEVEIITLPAKIEADAAAASALILT